MSRRKVYFKYEMPSSVVGLVKAIINDYKRREREIGRGVIADGVLERYIELNTAVERALDEVEVGIRGYLLEDIYEGKGYERSEAQYLLSKDAYYRRRRKLIHDIAVELSFI